MAETLGYQFDRVINQPIETNRQVPNISARNAIPTSKRWEGMECYVVSEETDYQLIGGIDNTFWVATTGNEAILDSTATHFLGDFDVLTLEPPISDSGNVLGDEYRVVSAETDGSVIDLGSGDISVYNGDILLHNGTNFFVKTRLPLITDTQNNFSRTINVSAQDIAPFYSEGDVEDRLIAYVNDLDYEKLETDSDVWIKFNDAVTLFNSSFVLVGDPCDFDPTLQTLPQNYYHTGSSALPETGDYVYEDEAMTTLLPIGWYSDGTKWYNIINSIGLVNTTLTCL